MARRWWESVPLQEWKKGGKSRKQRASNSCTATRAFFKHRASSPAGPCSARQAAAGDKQQSVAARNGHLPSLRPRPPPQTRRTPARARRPQRAAGRRAPAPSSTASARGRRPGQQTQRCWGPAVPDAVAPTGGHQRSVAEGWRKDWPCPTAPPSTAAPTGPRCGGAAAGTCEVWKGSKAGSGDGGSGGSR